MRARAPFLMARAAAEEPEQELVVVVVVQEEEEEEENYPTVERPSVFVGPGGTCGAADTLTRFVGCPGAGGAAVGRVCKGCGRVTVNRCRSTAASRPFYFINYRRPACLSISRRARLPCARPPYQFAARYEQPNKREPFRRPPGENYYFLFIFSLFISNPTDSL